MALGLGAVALIIAWVLWRRRGAWDELPLAIERPPAGSILLGRRETTERRDRASVTTVVYALASDTHLEALVTQYEELLRGDGFPNVRREDTRPTLSGRGQRRCLLTAMSAEALVVVSLTPGAWTDDRLPSLVPTPPSMRTFVRVETQRRRNG